MLIRKVCQCGVKLERQVSSEEVAREVIDLVRAAHVGVGHGPVTRAIYEKTISQIIKRRGLRRGKRRRGGQRSFREEV